MIELLSGTPTWVWVVLGCLIVVGVRAIWDTQVFLPVMFIVPVVLIGMRYKTLMYANNTIILGYVGALLAGIALGFWVYKNATIKVFKKTGCIEIPGNYTTLCLLLSIFAVRFAFGYYRATHTIIGMEIFFAEMIVNGLLVGYFLGRACAYACRYTLSV